MFTDNELGNSKSSTPTECTTGRPQCRRGDWPLIVICSEFPRPWRTLEPTQELRLAERYPGSLTPMPTLPLP